jgi:hypothetical protein
MVGPYLNGNQHSPHKQKRINKLKVVIVTISRCLQLLPANVVIVNDRETLNTVIGKLRQIDVIAKIIICHKEILKLI